MNQLYKKGISLLVLVITIVVLIILTGTIMLSIKNTNIFDNTQSTIDNYDKNAIIEDISIKIQQKKIKNEMQGIYEINMTEIIPIIEQQGTFNNNILKLTTEKGIEIWLYEIMEIPLQEYATITYENNILTVQTELTNNGYRVQYTTDAGNSWSLYTQAVTISDESGIQVRLLNQDGEVVSNTLRITGGVIGEIDNTNPVITIQPNGIGLAKNTQVTITVTDNNELANNNTYEYYLSTSQNAQTGGSWVSFTNGTAFTIGTNLTGTYYLHVKGVYDKEGNSSGDVVSESYTFDNTAPYSFTPTIGEVTETSIQINANTSDNNGQAVTYKYSIDNGTTWQDSNIFTNLLDGTTYSGIKVKAIDSVGNEYLSSSMVAVTISTDWEGECDIGWYVKNPNATTYSISKARELAGLALLTANVDSTVYYDSKYYANTTSGAYTTTGLDFTGKTINITDDIQLNKGTFSQTSGTWYYTPKGGSAIAVSSLTATNIQAWTPAGTFAGTLNGNGHNISGMYVKTTSEVATLITTLTGTIKNVHVTNVYAQATSAGASGIAGGGTGGIIDSCSTTNGYICGYKYAGGIGSSINATVVNSYNSATIELSYKCTNVYCGSSAIGGIVGFNSGKIANCYNAGTVVGGCRTGGFTGSQGWSNVSATIINGYNSGAISCSAYRGYGVGWIQGGTLSYCYGLSSSVTGSVGGTEANTTVTNTNNRTFSGSGTTWTLASSISPNGSATTSLLTALNAWVSSQSGAYNGVSLRTWKVDASKNGGLPILSWQ